MLFSPFERRAFGEAIVHNFDGWLVKPVRLESLDTRLYLKPMALRQGGEASPSSRPGAALRGAEFCWRKTMT